MHSGNLFFVASTTSCVIGLTWGGIQFSWGAAQVLVPLVLGLVGLGCFILYEAKVPGHPIVSCRASHPFLPEVHSWSGAVYIDGQSDQPQRLPAIILYLGRPPIYHLYAVKCFI